MMFKLKVENTQPEQAIHTIVLQCQIQIEAMRRRYNADEQKRLRDLFDEPSRGVRRCGRCSGRIRIRSIPRFTESIVAESARALHVMISISPRPNILPRSKTAKFLSFFSLAERSFMREWAECCKSGKFRGQRNQNIVCPLKFGKK